MLGKIRQKLDDWMVAVAFAEAGEHEMALENMGRAVSKRKVARKRVRREKRLELRAPGSGS
jgi:hypothetical protein